jgi:peroxiredoxin
MYEDHTDTLRPGDAAPDFDLPTADGTRVSLGELKGRPLLVFFLRGTWCPNCKKLMARLEADWEELTSRDLTVVCIAAQRIDGMTGARKFVEEHRYPFPILFDEKRQVVRAWGVYRPIGLDALHIAHPAVFLIDPEQTIRWIAVSPNQYTRPSTPDILARVEALQAPTGAGLPT